MHEKYVNSPEFYPGGGASGLHKDSWVDAILAQCVYTRFFNDTRLRDCRERLHLPNCNKATGEPLMAWRVLGV